MPHWLNSLSTLPPSVFALITVIETNGSTPCNIGEKLVVDADKLVSGTIGGGQLELQVIKKAHQLLSYTNFHPIIEEFALSSAFSQCCGGTLKIYFEPIDMHSNPEWLLQFKSLIASPTLPTLSAKAKAASKKNALSTILVTSTPSTTSNLPSKFLLCPDTPDEINGAFIPTELHNTAKQFGCERYYQNKVIILDETTYLIECFHFATIPQVVLYGAGHVAQSLIPLICQLPVMITWVDSRAEQFTYLIDPPENLRIICTDFIEVVPVSPNKAYHLVMTFSHDIDYSVCSAILKENRFSWLGMIGSKIKGKRFKHRLKDEDIDKTTLARFSCPIGANFKHFKSPVAVAISIAAELILQLNAQQST